MATKVILLFGVSTTWGTVFKGRSVRKGWEPLPLLWEKSKYRWPPHRCVQPRSVELSPLLMLMSTCKSTTALFSLNVKAGRQFFLTLFIMNFYSRFNCRVEEPTTCSSIKQYSICTWFSICNGTQMYLFFNNSAHVRLCEWIVSWSSPSPGINQWVLLPYHLR